MTRFWITLEQGVELVLDTLNLMKGGEVVVPKLSAMKIKDLISVLVPDCKVKVIGTRPGEKLHEMLLTEDEARRTKDIGKYYLVEPNHNWWDKSHFKEFPNAPENFNYVSNEVGELTKDDFLNFV